MLFTIRTLAISAEPFFFTKLDFPALSLFVRNNSLLSNLLFKINDPNLFLPYETFSVISKVKPYKSGYLAPVYISKYVKHFEVLGNLHDQSCSG